MKPAQEMFDRLVKSVYLICTETTSLVLLNLNGDKRELQYLVEAVKD